MGVRTGFVELNLAGSLFMACAFVKAGLSECFEFTGEIGRLGDKSLRSTG